MIENMLKVEQGQLATSAMDQSQAEDLQKTLSFGHAYAGAQPAVGGAALQLESIDATLRSVTYSAKSLVFWPSISQGKSSSLVEQYIRTNSFGSSGSPYVSEGGSPAMEDQSLDRHSQKVVFFATRRGTSMVGQMIKQAFAEDAESREASAGTLWLLEKLERELYKGLSDFSNNGAFDGAMSAIPGKLQNLNLQGLEQQIRQGDQELSSQAAAFDGYGGAQSVLRDLQGDAISESVIEDQANLISENFGMAGEIHAAPRSLSDFVKTFFPKERVNALGIQGGRAGYVVNVMATSAGDIALRGNVFLKPKAGPKQNQERGNVPGAPASATAAAVTDGSTPLKAGDKYMYEVSAANEQGEGVATAVSAQITLAADGDRAEITIAQPSSGATPTHYAVYRTSKQGAGAREFVGYVKSVGATTKFVDKGAKIQGAATAYMLDMRPEVLTWKQLAPMMKVPLAQVSLSKEFILLLAGCMILAAPRMASCISNIGKAS